MANPVSFENYRKDSGGTAKAVLTASAAYKRSGNTVTITITVTLSGWGHYYQAIITPTSATGGGSREKLISEASKTVTKTYTYTDAAAKTYSYTMESYVQTAAGYTGQSKTGTLSIDVPAAGAEVYIKVNGAWKKASKVYVKVNGAWKESNVKVNVGGTWK